MWLAAAAAAALRTGYRGMWSAIFSRPSLLSSTPRFHPRLSPLSSSPEEAPPARRSPNGVAARWRQGEADQQGACPHRPRPFHSRRRMTSSRKLTTGVTRSRPGARLAGDDIERWGVQGGYLLPKVQLQLRVAPRSSGSRLEGRGCCGAPCSSRGRILATSEQTLGEHPLRRQTTSPPAACLWVSPISLHLCVGTRVLSF